MTLDLPEFFSNTQLIIEKVVLANRAFEMASAYDEEVIQRIIRNHEEYWWFEESKGWFVSSLVEQSWDRSKAKVYDLSTGTCTFLTIEEIFEYCLRLGWPTSMSEEEQNDFVRIFKRWREHRRPIEHKIEEDRKATENYFAELMKSIPNYTPIDRHRTRMQLLGFRYIGIRSPEQNARERTQRITVCWNCQGPLNNYRHYECVSCNWILCRCGACGCGKIQSMLTCPICGCRFRQLDCRGCMPFCSHSCKRLAMEQYNSYLQSEQWKLRRQIRLRRDKETCQDCGDKATEVHHLTYQSVGNEGLEDLISLCHSCHAIRHGDLKEAEDISSILNFFKQPGRQFRRS